MAIGADQRIFVWDAASGAEVSHFELNEPKFNPYQNMAIEPLAGDQMLLLWPTGGNKGTLIVYDVKEGREVRRFGKDESRNGLLIVSPNQTTVATHQYNQLYLYNLNRGRRMNEITPDSGASPLLTAAFGPDGREIVTGSLEGVLRVFSHDGTHLLTQQPHDDPLTSIAVSPDGKFVLSASGRYWARNNYSGDWKITLWGREGLPRLHDFTGHTDGVEKVRFLPDGKAFVSASLDRTLRLWRIPDSFDEPASTSQNSTPVDSPEAADSGAKSSTQPSNRGRRRPRGNAGSQKNIAKAGPPKSVTVTVDNRGRSREHDSLEDALKQLKALARRGADKALDKFECTLEIDGERHEFTSLDAAIAAVEAVETAVKTKKPVDQKKLVQSGGGGAGGKSGGGTGGVIGSGGGGNLGNFTREQINAEMTRIQNLMGARINKGDFGIPPNMNAAGKYFMSEVEKSKKAGRLPKEMQVGGGGSGGGAGGGSGGKAGGGSKSGDGKP